MYKRTYCVNSPEVVVVLDDVYELLDPDGGGWAYGDHPAVEDVVVAMFNLGHVKKSRKGKK